MKFSLYLATLAALSVIVLGADKDAQTRLEPATTAMVVTALVPVVTNLLSGFVNALGGPGDYEDTVIYGRPMRIQVCGKDQEGQFCMQLTDRGTGHTHVGHGATQPEAIGDCTKKMFDDLISHDQLSLWDLCHLHITFPHPDTQNCPTAIINPCHLVSPIKTTTKPCVNKMGDKYCEQNKKRGHCENHNFQLHMLQDCFKACTDGTCQLGPVAPVDPCNTKPEHHNTY